MVIITLKYNTENKFNQEVKNIYTENHKILIKIEKNTNNGEIFYFYEEPVTIKISVVPTTNTTKHRF